MAFLLITALTANQNASQSASQNFVKIWFIFKFIFRFPYNLHADAWQINSTVTPDPIGEIKNLIVQSLSWFKNMQIGEPSIISTFLEQKCTFI